MVEVTASDGLTELMMRPKPQHQLWDRLSNSGKPVTPFDLIHKSLVISRFKSIELNVPNKSVHDEYKEAMATTSTKTSIKGLIVVTWKIQMTTSTN